MPNRRAKTSAKSAKRPARAAKSPIRRAKPTRKIEIHPATPARWSDVEQLFGPRGACAGCWCMWWKLPRSQFNKQKGSGNKRALKRLVERGPAPGLVAYVGGEPAGWIALAPREDYPGLERSRILQPVDDTSVWSVTCFFVGSAHRGRGLSVRLLREAVRFARAHGARAVEGYPVDTDGAVSAPAFVWTGLAAAFEKAGFREVARRSPKRPIMRYPLRRGSSPK